jgi:hypothetical protein
MMRFPAGFVESQRPERQAPLLVKIPRSRGQADYVTRC